MTYIRLADILRDAGVGHNNYRHHRNRGYIPAPKKIGKSGIAFSYDATTERLAQGDAAPGEEVALQQYSRTDVAPQLTRSFSLPFLQVTPKTLVRYTRYGASYDDTGALEGPALDRRFFEASVEARGPKLFKIFIGSFKDRVSHEAFFFFYCDL